MAEIQIESKIKELSKKQGLSIRQLCQKIDITENGLSKTFKNNSLKVETLQKVANILQVDIRDFFGGVGVNSLELENKYDKLKEEQSKKNLIILLLLSSLDTLYNLAEDTFENSKKILSEKDATRYEAAIEKAKNIMTTVGEIFDYEGE